VEFEPTISGVNPVFYPFTLLNYGPMLSESSLSDIVALSIPCYFSTCVGSAIPHTAPTVASRTCKHEGILGLVPQLGFEPRP
jgi:hypothetical protein